MTDEKIFRCPIGPPHQWGTAAIIKTIGRFINYLNAHQKAWHLLKASVPISSMRPTDQAQATDSGTEDCLYCEASGQFDSPSQATGQIKRRIFEQSRDASLRRISQKTWLRNFIERFRYNIFLTDHFSVNFHKFIACWFLKDSWVILTEKYV